MELLHGRLRGGEGVGQRSAESDKSDGGDRGEEAHTAAHVASEVADERGKGANTDESNEEAQPAAREARRGHEGKDELPRQSKDVEHCVDKPLAAKFDRLGELVGPAVGGELDVVDVEVEKAVRTREIEREA